MSLRGFVWARLLLGVGAMTPDEAHSPPSEHSVELTNDINEQVSSRRRRALGGIVVALCMSGASALIVVAAVHTQRQHEAERQLEELQREALRDGWRTLSAVAAEGVEATAAPPPAATQGVVPPAPATTNIVIVNVPSQQASTPASSGTGSIPSVGVPQPGNPGNTSGNAVPIYVPVPVLSAGSVTTALPGQSANNAGSQPNPAFPNGSPTQPTPVQPNGSGNVTPSAPSAAVPVAPPNAPIGTVPLSPP